MRRKIVAIMCFAVLGFVASLPSAIAQQKTAKACRAEWQANKAANQANGVTEKAYVGQCRGGSQKTVAACREEWRANKAANQANGVTEKAYVDQCRAGGTAAAEPTASPATPPRVSPAPSETPAPTTSTATAPVPRPASPSTRAAPPSSEAAAASEFSTEAQAKAHCPTDTVVWATLRSKVYHFSGTRYYGTTKNGAYMCEGDSTAAGMRAAKNEAHP
jgi:hypothetical protein